MTKPAHPSRPSPLFQTLQPSTMRHSHNYNGNNSPSKHYSRKQRGISLIEVLVALLILVISLLGVAAVQLRLQQFSQSAIARSQSSNALMDIVEKMRANRSAAINTQSYNTAFPNAPTACVPTSLRNAYAATAGLNDAATPAALAQAELLQLNSELACLLPLGAARIVIGQSAPTNALSCNPTLTNAAQDVVTIIVRYDDRKADLVAAQAAQATGTQAPVYNCFVEVVQL